MKQEFGGVSTGTTLGMGMAGLCSEKLGGLIPHNKDLESIKGFINSNTGLRVTKIRLQAGTLELKAVTK